MCFDCEALRANVMLYREYSLRVSLRVGASLIDPRWKGNREQCRGGVSQVPKFICLRSCALGLEEEGQSRAEI